MKALHENAVLLNLAMFKCFCHPTMRLYDTKNKHKFKFKTNHDEKTIL